MIEEKDTALRVEFSHSRSPVSRRQCSWANRMDENEDERSEYLENVVFDAEES